MDDRKTMTWNVEAMRDIVVKLTPYQMRAALALLQERDVKRAAAAAGCKAHTFNNHIRAVYKRLQINSITQLGILFAGGEIAKAARPVYKEWEAYAQDSAN